MSVEFSRWSPKNDSMWFSKKFDKLRLYKSKIVLDWTATTAFAEKTLMPISLE